MAEINEAKNAECASVAELFIRNNAEVREKAFAEGVKAERERIIQIMVDYDICPPDDVRCGDQKGCEPCWQRYLAEVSGSVGNPAEEVEACRP
jgi:hypothetical protein